MKKKSRNQHLFKTDGQAPLFLEIPVKTRDEILPVGSQGRVIDNFVNSLDLSAVKSTYKGGGSPAFHPRGLLKVILLAYVNNIYGCRPIAEMAAHDLRCYYFLEGGTPSHNTINRFRTDRLGSEGVLNIFNQLITMLSEEGMITFGETYIDGTLTESRASRTKIIWQQSVRRYAESNASKINEILKAANEAQQQDEANETSQSIVDSANDDEASESNNTKQSSEQQEGREADRKKNKRPASVHPSEEEMRKIRANIDDLNLSNSQKKELEKRLNRADELRQQDQMCGTRSGTPTTDPDSIATHPKNDPMRKGPCIPMYNTMLITNNQFILDYYLGGLATDMALFPLAMEAVGSRYEGSNMAADAGFGSYTNILLAQSFGITPFFKYNNYDLEQKPKYIPNKFESINFPYDETTNTIQCPGGQTLHAIRSTTTIEHNIPKTITTFRTDNCGNCKLKEQCHSGRHQATNKDSREVELNIDWGTRVKPMMEQRLNSEEGKRMLHQRSKDVEPTNAHLRWTGKFDRFRHFGINKCHMDLGLRAIAQNLQHYLNMVLKKGLDSINAPFLCIISCLNESKLAILGPIKLKSSKIAA